MQARIVLLLCLGLLFPATGTPQGQKAITNDDIVQMVKAGFGEDTIIKAIEASTTAFDTSVQGLLALKKAGVSDAVITAMLTRSTGAREAAAAKSGASAPVEAAPVKPASAVQADVLPGAGTSSAGAPSAGVRERASAPSNFVQPASQEDFKRLLMERYDGKTVVTMVSGLLAGEYKKAFIVGPGNAGLLWYHYHDSVLIPNRKRSNPLKLWGKKTSEMDQLDERTYADLDRGLNVTSLDRGEPLKVQKFYIMSDHIEFNLTTTRLSHLRDVDINKASKETTTTVSGGQVHRRTSVAGFGLRFRFFFDKESVLKAAKYDAVVSELDKYLLPKDEADKALAGEKDIQIEIGDSEETVLKKLGPPLKTLRVGNEKSFKYKDVTVTFRDGKVADVKLQ